MPLDTTGGYLSTWRIVPINPKTWQGTEPITGVKSVRISENSTDKVPKLQSGSMGLVLPAGTRFESGWYQIQMVQETFAGSTELVKLATLLFEQSDGTNDYGVETVDVNGQSVLKPVEDDHMDNGEHIKKWDEGSSWCLNRLAKSTPAPVYLDCTPFKVDRYYVFDSGTSCLKAVWKILDAGNKVMQIHGDGSIHIVDKPTKPIFELGRNELRFVKPGIDYTLDLSSVPNVYTAKLNGRSATATNDSPDSPTSTINRTYVKDEVETDATPVEGETLQHYADRKLEEASTVYETYNVTEDSRLEINLFDYAYWNLPDVYVGPMRLLSRSVRCEKGVTIQSKYGREVKLWRRTV